MQKHLLNTFLFVMIASVGSAQQRIVTAGSAASEIVCALGLCDKIVATDRTSQFPEKLQALPSIGYRNGIGAEGIIAQKPDMVIFEQEYVKDELISQLRSTGIETLIVEQNRSIGSTQKLIKDIASAVNRKKQGEVLISKMAAELEELQAKVNANTKRPKVLCVYARGQGSMQVGGSNSAFTLLDLAGAKNAAPQIDGYKPLNAESLILANPDYILFFDSGLKSVGGIGEVLKITGVAQTTAGRKRQIIAMDGVLLTSWGPQLAKAALELFNLTHPTAAN